MAIGIDVSMTYDEAYRRANVLAGYLSGECGIEVGSTVGISSPNDIYVPVVMAAAQMCGANIVCLPQLEFSIAGFVFKAAFSLTSEFDAGREGLLARAPGTFFSAQKSCSMASPPHSSS